MLVCLICYHPQSIACLLNKYQTHQIHWHMWISLKIFQRMCSFHRKDLFLHVNILQNISENVLVTEWASAPSDQNCPLNPHPLHRRHRRTLWRSQQVHLLGPLPPHRHLGCSSPCPWVSRLPKMFRSQAKWFRIIQSVLQCRKIPRLKTGLPP